MSIQPIIDVIAPHLAKQSAQSIVDGPELADEALCRYRLERDGKVLMCAVGVLLKDFNVSELEGLPASDLLTYSSNTCVKPEDRDHFQKVTQHLQSLAPDLPLRELGLYLDEFQMYHDADPTGSGLVGPVRRYADLLKQPLSEEEREAEIRADLAVCVERVQSHL